MDTQLYWVLSRPMRFSFLCLAAALFCGAAFADQVSIAILATTDLHGNIYPYDYYTGKPAERGLAKIATLVREQRATAPNSILIDCGDTIQGTPLEAVYQHYVETGHLPLEMHFAGEPLRADPMMLAMNELGYDAMVVGNHEWNFGEHNLWAAKNEAHFPFLSANTKKEPGADVPAFDAWMVKTIGGVKIAVVGVTTPHIPMWDPPEHWKGYQFLDGVTAVRSAVAEVRAKEHPDVVIVAAHAGLYSGPSATANAENMVQAIAEQVPGIDAIVFGHTHSSLPGKMIGTVLVMQPKNWGISLGRMDLLLNREPGGSWHVVSKESKLIPVTAEVKPDERILAIAQPYQDLAERYLNTRIADAPAELDARYSRIEDTPLIDAIQQVQLDKTHADVSFASSFNPTVHVPRGPVTVREIAALYPYENELYVLEGNGRMVREALENAARYFLSCTDNCTGAQHLINEHVIGYNFDMAEGVSYEIDIREPAGQRIKNLRWQGRPLADDQPLRVAVNNHRAGGSGGYTMFPDAKVVWKSGDEIRDLMVRYYTEHKTLPTEAQNNWRVVPSAALKELEREADAEAAAPPINK